MVDTAIPMLAIRLQQLQPHSMQVIMLRAIRRMQYRDQPVPAALEQALQRQAIHWVLESNTMQCCQVTSSGCSACSTDRDRLVRALGPYSPDAPRP
jgi:phage terminase large subunit-like protein